MKTPSYQSSLHLPYSFGRNERTMAIMKRTCLLLIVALTFLLVATPALPRDHDAGIAAEARFAIIIEHFDDGSSRYATFYFALSCRSAWRIECPNAGSCMAADAPSSTPQCRRGRVRSVRH